MFTVQRHHASTLHFDLRLEVDGVLVSWAVPKGPSLDPSVKRLAVKVGDHDLDHATYEGRDPGARGPGTKIVWDTGTLTNLTRRRGAAVPLAEALDAGHLKVALHGERLTGAFALTRTGGADSTSWLLVKVDDAGADRSRDVTEELTSVLTGHKLIVVVCDNGGFGVIDRLQTFKGCPSFNNMIENVDHRATDDWIDFAAHARSLGAFAEKVTGIAELEQALQRARQSERTYVVVIDTDPVPITEEGGAWWDVAVPETSERQEVRDAHVAYHKARADQVLG